LVHHYFHDIQFCSFGQFQVPEIQEVSTEKYINPEYPQNNCERDRKRKKKRKKSKRSKEKYGSKRDKNKSTELINENERNVSNYTEPEIDRINIFLSGNFLYF
jgi:hypothetical protein